MVEPVEIEQLIKVISIFDKLQIRYAISGSVASSLYGSVRFTNDVDIAVEPFDDKADKFASMIEPSYYLSRQAMQQALKNKTNFNIIHLETAFKVDFFINSNSLYDKQLMLRRKTVKLSNVSKRDFTVVAPEDIILLKLRAYPNNP